MRPWRAAAGLRAALRLFAPRCGAPRARASCLGPLLPWLEDAVLLASRRSWRAMLRGGRRARATEAGGARVCRPPRVQQRLPHTVAPFAAPRRRPKPAAARAQRLRPVTLLPPGRRLRRASLSWAAEEAATAAMRRRMAKQHRSAAPMRCAITPAWLVVLVARSVAARTAVRGAWCKQQACSLPG